MRESTVVTEVETPGTPTRHPRSGILFALLSAAAFGGAGPLAKSLLEIGWSPAALVALRLGGASLLLAVPAAVTARGWRLTRRSAVRLIGYGVLATAGAQLCYFSAVQYVPVGVAILLEFTAPIWLIGVFWIRDRRPPRMITVIAAVIAMTGMLLVLDVGSGGGFDLRGLIWGLAAAACLCCYFLLADEDSEERIPVLVVAASGTGIGAVVVAGVGLVGLLPMQAAAGRSIVAGAPINWLVPAILLVLVPTVLAYASGIVAIRRLGSAVASFVGLAEALFAVLFSVVLLAQVPGPIQLVGVALVIIGIAIVQRVGARSGRAEQ